MKLVARIRTSLTATPRRRTLTLFLGVTLLFGLITWFYMGRALTSCSNVILTGLPGDATAGLTWLTWADQHVGPIPGFSHLTNAPFGESLRMPFQITSALTIPTIWFISKLTTPLCSWNLMVFFGYLSSAMAMFAFMRWLTRNAWVAFFAGFAISYMPYHQMNALGHLSYMFNFIFTLFLWAFVAFWRRPTPRAAALMAVTTAACAYIDGYFILLGGLLAGATLLGATLLDLVILKRPAARRKALWQGLAMYTGVLILCLLPIAWVQHKYSQVITTALSSSRNSILAEAQVYSARPLDYLLPADNNPLLPLAYKTTFRPSTLHGSNYTESTLYIGLVVLVLAIFAWVYLWRHRRKLATEELQGLPLPFLMTVLTFTLIVAFAFSLPPIVWLFNHRLPMPTWFIIHITALWRVFSRLYLILETCLVILAGLGLWFVIRRRRTTHQALITAGVVFLVFLDFLTQSYGVVWSFNKAPDTYNWLKTQTNVHLVAEYPLSEPPSQGISDYLTYQQIDGKDRFNTSRSDSPDRALHLSMTGLADAQTLPILRALGVNLVLEHRQTADGLPGLQRLRYDQSHYNDDAVWTYRLLPGDTATYAVVAATGFHAPVIDTTLHSEIGMGSHGVLQLEQLPGAAKKDTVHVTLSAKAPGQAELISFTQNGVVRWQGTVAGPTPIEFDADPALPIDVIPYTAYGEETIQLSDLKAAP